MLPYFSIIRKPCFMKFFLNLFVYCFFFKNLWSWVLVCSFVLHFLNYCGLEISCAVLLKISLNEPQLLTIKLDMDCFSTCGCLCPCLFLWRSSCFMELTFLLLFAGFGEPSGIPFGDHLFAWYFVVFLGIVGRKILSCQWLAAWNDEIN